MAKPEAIALAAPAEESGPLASGVRCANPLQDPDWDAQLARFPGATFFHTRSWAEVLCATYGYTPCYLVHDSRLGRSVLPLMDVRSPLTGRRGIALPFTDECDALSINPAIGDSLVRAALEEAAARRWRYLEIRGGQTWSEAPASVRYHGHIIQLEPSPAVLFSRLHSSTQRNVRKATRSKLAVEISRSLESVRIFHRLLCQTRQRLGVPPQPLRFFENLHRYALAREHGCVVLARWEGIPVAGALFLHCGRHAMYKYGASDDLFQFLRPNNLVMWNAIEWHAARGFEVLDLGRTSLGNDGLRRFKLGWGSRERSVDYVRYDLRARQVVPTADRSSGWHSRFFRLLPVSVSRLVGTLLYRHAA